MNGQAIYFRLRVSFVVEFHAYAVDLPLPGVGRSAMKQLAEHLYVMNQAIARTLQKSWSSPPFGKLFGDI